MADSTVQVDVNDGQIGIAGVGTLHVGIMNFYGRLPAAAAPVGADAGPIPLCPYPGLEYFGPNEADLFFGRDAAIERLSEAVRLQNLTALIGASGTGKSSVVLAGLAPHLHRTGNWIFAYFRVGTEPLSCSRAGAQPDRDPFRALARALVPLYVASADETDRIENTNKLASKLKDGQLALHDVFGDYRSRNKGRRILLIADQFEEVFTLVEDEASRRRFIDVLLAGFPDPAQGTASDIGLILTLRADFYGHALRHRPLADALQGNGENLGPMTRDELHEAVVCPAGKKGVSFEPGLVQTLLDDVEGKPGGLPLLQFALREMWGQQQNRTVTRKSYDAIGGVEGALAQRAETIFGELTGGGADERIVKTFRRLFTRLVTLGEGQEDTRRMVERRELGDEAWHLAQRLAGEDNRLVVTSVVSNAVTNAPIPGRETAEVVHEALIRHWPRLVDWIDKDRIFQAWLRQLHGNIVLWLKDLADDGPLLRGGVLIQATDWLAKRHDDFSLEERSFVEASIALRRHEEEAKETAERVRVARDRERVAERERLLRQRAAVFGASTVLAFGLAGLAWWFRTDAAWQRDQAIRQESLALTAVAAGASRDGRGADALRLALASWPRTNSDARPQLQRALRVMGDATGLGVEAVPALKHGRAVHSATFSPDGLRVLTASGGSIKEPGEARVWNAVTGASAGPPMRHQGPVTSAAFSPDGMRVVTASRDDAARLWDAATGAPAGPPLRHGAEVLSVAFSPDGARVATASRDGTAQLWDSATGVPAGPPLRHSNSVRFANFNPDGTRVVTASSDGTARLWDTATGAPVGPPMRHEKGVNFAAFSPDGMRVVTTSEDRTARLWDAATGAPAAPPMRHMEDVNSASFSPDGARIATVSGDLLTFSGGVGLWNAITAVPIWMFPTRLPTNSVAFNPDGTRLIVGLGSWVGKVGATLLFDAASGARIGPPLPQAGAVMSTAFSPDGAWALIASRDGMARLWDIRWTRGQLPAIACALLPKNQANISQDGSADLAELANRYGVKIREPICRSGPPPFDPARIDTQ